MRVCVCVCEFCRVEYARQATCVVNCTEKATFWQRLQVDFSEVVSQILKVNNAYTSAFEHTHTHTQIYNIPVVSGNKRFRLCKFWRWRFFWYLSQSEMFRLESLQLLHCVCGTDHSCLLVNCPIYFCGERERWCVCVCVCACMLSYYNVCVCVCMYVVVL